MNNYNTVILAKNIGEWLTATIGDVGSNTVNLLLTAGAGFGMVISIIVGITALMAAGKEIKPQEKQMLKKRASNSFISAISLALIAGTAATILFAIPINFEGTNTGTAVLSALSHNTIVGSYSHLPLI